MCDKYLLSYYKDAVVEILKHPDELKHFPINVEFVELIAVDTALGKNFLEEPEKTLEEWNNAVKKVQRNLISQGDNDYMYKENIHCRIHKFPLYPDFHRNKFPQNEDTNKFLEISGTVIRISAIKMFEYHRQYICSKCKYTMNVTAQYELKNVIIPPKKCGNPESCKSTNIVSLGELSPEFCKDYQEIKIQETVSKLDVGSIPTSMWVTLEDDLVDSCKPGDNITVCGFVKRRQNQFYVGKKMEIELVIKANHICVDNATGSSESIEPKLKGMFQAFWKTYEDKPLVARDIILKSICPQLWGLYLVKLAVAVVLAGGSNTHNNVNSGVTIRTEPHLLLVGDAGTGKSQLLRFASKIIPRSVLTTGVGSTAAGLTVAAVMESGEWQLEGGALVMSDGGICCIDEFNTMKEHDRTSIHEAMEQQTISVAKAGIVCKLSTRCSILAATNPKGNLDLTQGLNMNVALASPLLSRFDLILLIKDRIDEEWDSQLIDYMFSTEQEADVNWSVETLQAYYTVVKSLNPVLTEESNKILSNYYQIQRRKNFRNKSRTTVRLLDSLVRLSQGHARLMCHQQVQIMDAVTAVMLIETASETDSSIFDLRFDVRNDFPLDPIKNHQKLTEIILKKLELDHLLTKDESSINTKETDRLRNPDTSPKQKKESRFFRIPKPNEDEVNETRNQDNNDETENPDNGSTKPKLSKRSRSPTHTEQKKLKLQKQSEVTKHLEVLKSIPSVNSIFDNVFGEDEESFELNLNERKQNSDNNENKIEKASTNKNSDMLKEKTIEISNVSVNETSSRNVNTSSTQFQTTLTMPAPREEISKSNNFFENGDANNFDISFSNIKSSTQRETPANSLVAAKLKKFRFKSVVQPEIQPEKSTITSTSLFETEENVEDFEFDI